MQNKLDKDFMIKEWLLYLTKQLNDADTEISLKHYQKIMKNEKDPNSIMNRSKIREVTLPLSIYRNVYRIRYWFKRVVLW